MKKKYLAYMLSAAMLTSMMPTTSVYAEVTGMGVDSPVAYAAEKAAGSALPGNGLDTLTVTEATADSGLTGGKVEYEKADGAAKTLKFNVKSTVDPQGKTIRVVICANDSATAVDDAKYRSDEKEITGSGDSFTANDVTVDVKGLPAGHYKAYVQLAGEEHSKEGVAFEVTAKKVTLDTSKFTAAEDKKKTYDGEKALTISDVGQKISVKNAADNENVTVTAVTAEFEDANVGTGKKINAKAVTLSSNNYIVDTAQGVELVTDGVIEAAEPTEIKASVAGKEAIVLGTSKVTELEVPAGTANLNGFTTAIKGVNNEENDTVGTVEWKKDGQKVSDFNTVVPTEAGVNLEWTFTPKASGNYKAPQAATGTLKVKLAKGSGQVTEPTVTLGNATINGKANAELTGDQTLVVTLKDGEFDEKKGAEKANFSVNLADVTVSKVVLSDSGSGKKDTATLTLGGTPKKDSKENIEVTVLKAALKNYAGSAENFKTAANDQAKWNIERADAPEVNDVQAVTMKGLVAPAIGQTPVAADAVTFENSQASVAATQATTVEWYVVDSQSVDGLTAAGLKDKHTGNFTEQAGKQYVAKVVLTAPGEKKFVDAVKAEGAITGLDTAVIKDPQLAGAEKGNTLTFLAVYPELKAEATEITNVSVTGWKVPKAGDAITNFNNDIAASTTDVTGSTISTTVEWKKFSTDLPNDDAAWNKGEVANNNFEKAEKYAAKVTLTADTKDFATQPVVTIDGGATAVGTKRVDGEQKKTIFFVHVDGVQEAQTIKPGTPQATEGQPVKNTVEGTELPASDIKVPAKVDGTVNDKAEVTVNADTLKVLGEQTNTNVGLVIEADAATVTLPKEVLKAIADKDTAHDKGAVIKVEKGATVTGTPDMKQAVKVDVTVDGTSVGSFGATGAKVTLSLPTEITDVAQAFVYMIDRAGDKVTVKGDKLDVEAAVARAIMANVTMKEAGEIGVFTTEQTTPPAEKVELTGTPTVDAKTYDAKTKLKDVAITGDVTEKTAGTAVEGNWVWDESDAETKAALDTVLTVQDQAPQYQVKFVPKTNADKYSPLVAKVTVTVNAAKPTVQATTTDVYKATKDTMKGSEIKALLKAYGVDGKELTGGTWEIKKNDTVVGDEETPFKGVDNNQMLKVAYTPAGADKNYVKSDEAEITFNFTETKPRQLSFAQSQVSVTYGGTVENVLSDNAKDEADKTKAPAVTYSVELATGGDASAVATVDSATGAVTVKGVGTVKVKASAVKGTSATESDNYGAAEASYTLDIKKAVATVTVKATPNTVKVGATTEPVYSHEVTGMVNSETADQAVTGNAVYSIIGGKTFAELVKAPGSYQVEATGLTATANYELNVVPATVTVEDNGVTPPRPNRPSGGGSSHGHGGGSSYTSKNPVHVITSGSSKNGRVEISDKNAKAGDKVTVTVKPDDGYELDKIIIKDRVGSDKIDVEKDGNKYTFVMPKSAKVEVEPIFVKVDKDKDKEDKKEEETNKGPIEMNTITTKTFNDVRANDWFKTAVDYVVSNGIMAGVGDREFAPNQNMTRAMVWQVLAKIDGVNTVGGDKWYSRAMEWATSRKITDGSNVNGKVTREQIASMLYRYAKDKGVDVSMKGTLANFPDASKASSYATEALQWAVGNGIINGMDGKLNPQGTATRAQVATMLMNFDKVVK